MDLDQQDTGRLLALLESIVKQGRQQQTQNSDQPFNSQALHQSAPPHAPQQQSSTQHAPAQPASAQRPPIRQSSPQTSRTHPSQTLSSQDQTFRSQPAVQHTTRTPQEATFRHAALPPGDIHNSPPRHGPHHPQMTSVEQRLLQELIAKVERFETT